MTMQKKFLIKILFFVLLIFSTFSLATRSSYSVIIEEIVAVVNDQIITRYDVKEKFKLFIFTSGIQPTERMIREVESQILKNLIVEKLKSQAIDNYKITVEDEIVDDYIKFLAMQDNISVQDVKNNFSENNISFEVFRENIANEIGWKSLIESKFSAIATVTDYEVDLYIEMMKKNPESKEFLTNEIFIPFDEYSKIEIEQIISMINQINQNYQENKVSMFRSFAKKFSASKNSSRGGDLGWISMNSMKDEIKNEVSGLSLGEISKPILSSKGIYFYLISDTRIKNTNIDEKNRISIKQKILTHKLDQLAIKFLDDLQRDSVIESK